MIPFEAHAARIERHLRDHYGIAVITRDIPDPLIGDLDGAEIHIDYALTPEQRLFLLAHLFGHTVQWNTDQRSLEIGRPQTPPVPEPLLIELLAYEQQAARYADGLLHELDIHDLDQWLADYSASDLAYLAHFYRTGEKADFSQFRSTGAPLLEPLPVPPFTPQRRVFRSDGIVI